jgi:hypothetical protein
LCGSGHGLEIKSGTEAGILRKYDVEMIKKKRKEKRKKKKRKKYGERYG